MAGAIDNETQAGAESPARISAEKPVADKSRVFIVDDHTMFREGLRQLIEHDPGLNPYPAFHHINFKNPVHVL